MVSVIKHNVLEEEANVEARGLGKVPKKQQPERCGVRRQGSGGECRGLCPSYAEDLLGPVGPAPPFPMPAFLLVASKGAHRIKMKVGLGCLGGSVKLR